MAAVLAALLSGCGPPTPAPRHAPVRNVVLVSIDTLRADRLGVYGHPRPTSPELDAFATRGAVFEDATATAPWTQPSHASMLTGLYPSESGIRRVGDALGEGVSTLAERLDAAGFETVGIANSIFLGVLRRGFDHWHYVPEDDSVEDGADGEAGPITDLAVAALSGPAERRLFLFVHYFDVHTPYLSRPEFEAPFLDGRDLGRYDRSTRFVRDVDDGTLVPTGAELDAISRLYEAGIRQLDGQLGRLLREVEATLGWDETLVVVTSDHGDAFFEHGTLSHGSQMYQEVLRVPLLLFGGGVPAGVRVAAPVSLVDVVPTVLAATGVTAGPETSGVDLARFWSGDADAIGERPLFAQSAPAIAHDTRRALRRGRYKLVADLETGARELYDVEADPGETRDLAAERPERLAALEEALDAFDARHPLEAQDETEMDPDVADRLRALGYLE